MNTISTQTKPARDTVLYDGRCRFCRSQIAILRGLDLGSALAFTSLHDPSVGRDFPELSHDDLLAQMVVVDRAGRARGGADAVKYLSRRLPLLWPLAVPLHIPGTEPLWATLYRFIARNRLRIAGSCDDGTCKLPRQ
ncbi:MAG: thiol-disulfide oxidoreductase DCC family protein [Planctomycetia bacterium]